MHLWSVLNYFVPNHTVLVGGQVELALVLPVEDTITKVITLDLYEISINKISTWILWKEIGEIL